MRQLGVLVAAVCHFPSSCPAQVGHEDAREKGRKGRDSLDYPRANILGDFEASSVVGALPGGDDGNTAGAAITILSLVPDIGGSLSMLVSDGKGRCSITRWNVIPLRFARNYRTL